MLMSTQASGRAADLEEWCITRCACTRVSHLFIIINGKKKRSGSGTELNEEIAGPCPVCASYIHTHIHTPKQTNEGKFRVNKYRVSMVCAARPGNSAPSVGRDGIVLDNRARAPDSPRAHKWYKRH